MPTIADIISERTEAVVTWLTRLGVEAELEYLRRGEYQDYYNVVLSHPSTPLTVTVSDLGVPGRLPGDAAVYYAMTWVADGANTEDEPTYEYFLRERGFFDDDDAKASWERLVNQNAFFDAIPNCHHSDLLYISQLEYGEDVAKEEALKLLKGEISGE